MTKDYNLAYMVKAISEAAISKVEDETDPLVGAVLVSKNGILQGCAHKGQYEPGEHAEYSLLIGLDTETTHHSTIYTTMEPCVYRTCNKNTCTQYLIHAGIQRVFIGILDPNPRIRQVFRNDFSQRIHCIVLLQC